ncbi:hypothetical protein M1432_01550 [Patescibacteria group bacterium]|nr:hypothetical protein [Patescibacteria group bacterium]
MPDQQNQPVFREQFVAEPVSVGFPWRLFVFSLVLFLLSVLIYFGLKFGYESYLQKQSDGLDTQLAQLSNQISQQDQQQFVGFYSQLVNLKTVLGSHAFTGNVFPFLEKDTLPQVYYTDAKFSASGDVLSLTGQAASLQVLAEQTAEFEQASELQSATLLATSFNPGGTVNFSLQLVFNPSYLVTPQY